MPKFMLTLWVVGVSWVCAFADPEASKKGVEDVIARMEAAVLAGKPEEYMVLVDPANTFFVQEQSEWAKDLVENRPESFDLVIGGEAAREATMAGADVEPEYGEERAVVPLTMSWTLKGEKKQTVKFAAEFHKRDQEWKYGGERLEAMEGEGFTIRYPKGYESVAKMILVAFPPAKAHVDAGFQVTNTRHEHIKLYDKRAVLQASVYLSMYKTDLTLSGWNEKGESIKFATWYTSTESGWAKAFAHEYGHVATWELGPKAKDLPWWVAEGAAELAAEDFPPDTRESSQRWAVRASVEQDLAAWRDITDYRTTSRGLRSHPYRQGHAFIGYISDKYGREARNAWLAALCHGKSLDESSQQALGLGFEALDTQWRASLTMTDTEDFSATFYDSQAVERTLTAMEAAVLAADVDGYMANVLRGDPEFEMEQLNFAKDLLRKKPDEFDITVGKLTVRDNLVRTEMTLSWHIPGQRAEKRRTVKFPAKFVRENTRWLYAGEDWVILAADGVRIYHPKGLEESAERAAQHFAEVRAGVEKQFELDGTEFAAREQKIKLYKTMKHLQASIYLSYEDGLAGWNEPGESIKMLGSRGEGDFHHVLAHEYGHVASFWYGPKANEMPWWLLEGVAEAAVETNGATRDGVNRMMASLSRRGRLVKWEDLSDFYTVTDANQGLVYSQGHAMVGYLVDTHGRPKLNAWLKLMANGRSMEEASQTVYGQSWGTLDEGWRGSLPGPKSNDPEGEADNGQK
jgi:hypothetical protein